MKKNPGSFE